MGLSTSADEATFSKWREAELKHCRLGMMAAAGILAGETAPFLLGKDVSGPAFGHMAQVPQWASVFPVATMIAAEASNIKVDDKGNFQYCGGKYNWDPARLFSKMSTKQQEAMETRELNNGRLAMIATIGILFQEGYFKESAIQQLLAVTGTA
uniref:Light harvesting protein n=1 Tax=Chromera velia CCMP2878 TaxID=1169474 RepID=A0A0G4H852_9ALVE|eukprot:Cvel_25057.t1-p1 / transcript=Cvel_25057.t1 / gene=Cvel_25057 / organism=Chromera_velia_CCMP2878 / gene_product=hypothetical protein / transcript_product=hypothetical protein / location=Cvel_scaffold2787:10373-12208(-) / protein_length=152 / sequence_SO=supercontig / SO=protein_coding / is_pseudo=false